jgi:exosome complex component RRP43
VRHFVGSITTADGSALVKWGETTIVCGVKAELAEPELDRPLDGWIGMYHLELTRCKLTRTCLVVPNVDLPPLCSPKYKPGPPADESQIISDRLFEVLSCVSTQHVAYMAILNLFSDLRSVIDTKTLCVEPGKVAWVLYVDATCINLDGSIFDTTLLAMICALQNSMLFTSHLLMILTNHSAFAEGNV